MITFTIPGKPGAKGRPRFSRVSGTAYTPAKTRNLERTIESLALQARGDKPVIEGPIRVSVVAQFAPAKSWPKRRRAAALDGTDKPVSRPDIDNIAKAVTDACNRILYADDSQIVSLAAVKRFGPEDLTLVVVEAA